MTGTLLDENASKELLASYGLARPRHLVVGPDEVALAYTRFRAANTLGYPVVVKTHGGELAHKTVEGGVVLGVRNDRELMDAAARLRARFPGHGLLVEEQVTHAHEFLLGMVHDATFGPVVSFGTGGSLAEVFDDVAFRAVPVDRSTARHMGRSTRVGRAFAGDGGAGPDLPGVVDAIMAISRLATDLGHLVRAVEINPLAWTGETYLALDAKVQLEEDAVEDWNALSIPGGSSDGDAKGQIS